MARNEFHHWFIAAHRDREEVVEFIPSLLEALRGHDIEAELWYGDKRSAEPSIEPDVVLVLGGDGFLMHTIHAVRSLDAPIYGVNYGQVGFLMNPRMAADELLRVFLSGDLKEVDYPLLRATVTRTDGTRTEELAFNDLVLERSSGQTVHLATYIDGVFLNQYSGDGLVVATAGGSSAYSLAAGGPVMHEHLQGMLVTPLYPHRPVQFHSLQFPVMLPLASRIEVRVGSVEKRPARMVADGRSVEEVKHIVIDDSGIKVRLLRESGYNFVATLVQKIIGGQVGGSLGSLPAPGDDETST